MTFPKSTHGRLTERHLQCVWYDERLRPAALATIDGTPVEVLSPGRWNLEAGPDFLDARIRVGDRTLEGDVEVHINAADWIRHRHSSDSHYGRVVLHIIYAPESISGAGLPPSLVHVALRDALAANPRFSFDDIDLAAYPSAILPKTPRPCELALSARDPADAVALLRAAGLNRLRSKADAMAGRASSSGDRLQTFYEDTMAALGYKQNAANFRLLARTVPLAAIDEARPTADELNVIYLGQAGLLGDPAKSAAGRADWDAWFRLGGGAPALRREDWTLAGIRPANRPERRLRAAANMFHEPRALLDAIDAAPFDDARAGLRHVAALLSVAAGAVPATKERLLGKGRIAAILTNVVVPLLASEGRPLEALAEALPPEDLGAPARETAIRLFGRDHNPALYARSGILQQGLLAIFRDFCLAARDGCDECKLASFLTAATPEGH